MAAKPEPKYDAGRERERLTAYARQIQLGEFGADTAYHREFLFRDVCRLADECGMNTADVWKEIQSEGAMSIYDNQG